MKLKLLLLLVMLVMLGGCTSEPAPELMKENLPLVCAEELRTQPSIFLDNRVQHDSNLQFQLMNFFTNVVITDSVGSGTSYEVATNEGTFSISFAIENEIITAFSAIKEG